MKKKGRAGRAALRFRQVRQKLLLDLRLDDRFLERVVPAPSVAVPFPGQLRVAK